MKVIDILNMLSEGTLEDGFEFEFGGHSFIYCNTFDELRNEKGETFGEIYTLDCILNDKVEIFKNNKKIDKLKIVDEGNDNVYLYEYIKEMNKKINEIIDYINNKEEK